MAPRSCLRRCRGRRMGHCLCITTRRWKGLCLTCGTSLERITAESATRALFEFVRNYKFNGRNFFATKPDFLKRNQFGGTIGGLWVKKGHSVFFSSRHPEELKDMIAKLGSLAKAGTVEEAVAFGDVLFIAVPYGAIPQIGKDYSARMKGKVMLDACNAVSYHSGLPISVVDLERARPPLRVGLAPAGASYVFNASGQTIDLGGLLCLFDADGPCANAVKDAQRTKTHDDTRNALAIVWGTNALAGRTAETVRWYRELVAQIPGATVEDVALV